MEGANEARRKAEMQVRLAKPARASGPASRNVRLTRPRSLLGERQPAQATPRACQSPNPTHRAGASGAALLSPPGGVGPPQTEWVPFPSACRQELDRPAPSRRWSPPGRVAPTSVRLCGTIWYGRCTRPVPAARHGQACHKPRRGSPSSRQSMGAWRTTSQKRSRTFSPASARPGTKRSSNKEGQT
jgi:hypothetical protein